jgi:hypothetical protein
MTTQTSSGEQRRFKRIPCEGTVTLYAEQQTATGKLYDLSFNGALMQRTEGWTPEPGAPCRIAILLEHSSDLISMDARVAHVRDDRIGLACLSIDLDSVSRLRRLVELNLGNPALLDRELAALWGP